MVSYSMWMNVQAQHKIVDKDFLPSESYGLTHELLLDLRGSEESSFCRAASHSPYLKTVLIWGQQSLHCGSKYF